MEVPGQGLRGDGLDRDQGSAGQYDPNNNSSSLTGHESNNSYMSAGVRGVLMDRKRGQGGAVERLGDMSGIGDSNGQDMSRVAPFSSIENPVSGVMDGLNPVIYDPLYMDPLSMIRDPIRGTQVLDELDSFEPNTTKLIEDAEELLECAPGKTHGRKRPNSAIAMKLEGLDIYLPDESHDTREKNRLAAKRFRHRRETYTAELERTIRELESSNESISRLNSALEERNQALKRIRAEEDPLHLHPPNNLVTQ